jgi:hypothetical protein
MVSFARVKKFAAALPGVEESTSYGTPALKVRGKLMARLREDNETLVLRVAWEERERVLAVSPEVFFLTDHYRNHPWVLLRLPAATPSQVRAGLRHAWQQSAPRSLLLRAGSGEGAVPPNPSLKRTARRRRLRRPLAAG